MVPFIKWAGGKRRFANDIVSILGTPQGTYYEPFIGGGAVLLHLMPPKAKCSDINPELINVYKVVKKSSEELIETLRDQFVPFHNIKFYYKIRSLDRDKEQFESMSDVYRAARFLYLNKTCYNGLWRVNQNGENNVPFGKYKKPSILQESAIIEASNYFNQNNVQFVCKNYIDSVKLAKKGDVVYFDPPYDVEQGHSGFVAYTKSGFNRDEQLKLKELCDKLIKKGVKVAISNSDTDFIRQLYSSGPYYFYRFCYEFSINRTIGSTKDSRRKYTEVLIIGEENGKD